MFSDKWYHVTKQNPCPICGTHDWCCYQPAEDGYGDVYLCNRYTDGSKVISPGGDTTSRVSSGYYLLIGVGKGGNSGFYREASDVKDAEDNGFRVWRKGANSENAVYGKATKKDLVPVGIIEETDDAHKDMIYRALMSKLPLKVSHKKWLLSEGWHEEFFRDNMLCSFPVDDWMRNWHKNCRFLETDTLPRRSNICAELINEFGKDSLVGVPGFYIKTDKKTGEKYWYFESRSGIGFPLFNECGQIVRIRVRMDFIDCNKTYEKDSNGIYFIPEEDSRKRYVSWKGMKREEYDGTFSVEKESMYRATGKYRSLSSFSLVNDYDAGTCTNRYEMGCEAGNIVGLVTKPSDNLNMVIMTEGEKKAIVGNSLLKMPFLVIPGVNSYGKLFTTRIGKNILEFLQSSGTQLFAIAFDADKYTNAAVLQNEEGFARALLEKGFRPIILSWDSKKGKGLDDALLANAQLRADELISGESADGRVNIDSYYSKLKEKYKL